MDRRTLLTASTALIGSSIAGCLENSDMVDNTDTAPDETADETGNESASTDDASTDDATADDATADDATPDDATPDDSSADAIRRAQITDLGIQQSNDLTVSVSFDSDTITITGTIIGNNSCYTVRLGDLTTEDQTLVVDIESYEDADEDEGCTEALVQIKYEAVIETEGDRPSVVTVRHNGDEVHTTERS